jgi:thiamine pyrophosphokinase
MLILPKHSIDKKNTFWPILPNAYAILKSDNFKNTIFKNAIFKIVLIEIVLPNMP